MRFMATVRDSRRRNCGRPPGGGVFSLSAVMVLSLFCQPAYSQAKTAEENVREFVHQHHVHGVPYVKAKALSATALPTLQAMLDDRAEEEHWAKIVAIIGFIGHESMVDPLIEFLETTFAREVSVFELRALIEVNTALGHIAGTAGAAGANALDYLAEGCRVRSWEDKGIAWSYGQYTGDRLGALLARMAVNGLSFSGTDRAREVLFELKRAPESPEAAASLEPNIQEGFKRINRIQAVGRAKAFGKGPAAGAPGAPSGKDSKPSQSGAQNAAFAATTHAFTVNRHVATIFAAATATANFAAGTTLLQTDDGNCTDEVVCDVALTLSVFGTFGTFTDGLEFIDSGKQLTKAFAKAGNFKIVTVMKDSCGVTGTYLACAKSGKKNVVAVSTVNPDVWVHEFGHNQKLCHRDNGCTVANNGQFNIMHSANANTNSVNSSECIAIAFGTGLGNCGAQAKCSGIVIPLREHAQ